MDWMMCEERWERRREGRKVKYIRMLTEKKQGGERRACLKEKKVRIWLTYRFDGKQTRARNWRAKSNKPIDGCWIDRFDLIWDDLTGDGDDRNWNYPTIWMINWGYLQKKKKKKKGGRSNGQRNRALGIINRRSHRYRPVDIRWGQSKARNWRQQQKNSASPLLTRETGQYYRKIKNKKKGFHRAPRYGGRSDPRSRSWQFGIIPYCMYCIVYCVLCMVWYGMVWYVLPSLSPCWLRSPNIQGLDWWWCASNQ